VKTHRDQSDSNDLSRLFQDIKNSNIPFFHLAEDTDNSHNYQVTRSRIEDSLKAIEYLRTISEDDSREFYENSWPALKIACFLLDGNSTEV
jgi:hypothetical protein